jgi:ATP-dependent protease HslVU (ClpYQ) peptidase subunit
MTTIAANRYAMAADTRVTFGDSSYPAEKIFRVDGAIIGCAGDSEAAFIFCDWYPKRAQEPFKLPADLRDGFIALVLTIDGLFVYGGRGKREPVLDEVMAVGCGSALALAAFDTMRALNKALDPQLAVHVAALRNGTTSGPYQVEKL